MEFQVVPPCGGHLGSASLPLLQIQFQVVPPCGGHPDLNERQADHSRFKSCPRVGGILVDGFDAVFHEVVSSRAPVWGASFS